MVAPVPDKPSGRAVRGAGIGVGALAVLGLSVCGVRDYAGASAISGQYRTSATSMGNISTMLPESGTVSLVKQVSAAFPSSGLVDTVNVAVGQHVTAGQTMATMDTSGLNAVVLDAQAQLAQAQVAVTTGTTSTDPTSINKPGSTTTGPRSSVSSPAAPGTPTSSAPSPTVAAALKESGRKLASQITLLDRDVRAEQVACAPLLVAPPGPTPTPTATMSAGPPRPGVGPTGPRSTLGASSASSPSSTSNPTPTSTPTSVPIPSATSSSPSAPTSTATATTPANSTTSASTTNPNRAVDAGQLQACMAAIKTSAAAVSRSTGTLGTLNTALARVSTHTSPKSGGNGSSTFTNPTSPKGGNGSSANGSASAGSGSGGMSPAGAVIQDQLAVTQAQAAVKAATLIAPISGVVGAIGLTAGQSATSSSAISIVGHGDAQVIVDVPLTALPQLAVGQAANVTASGGGSLVSGSVTQIGILPASTTSSSPTYPVTIVVPDPPRSLLSGSQAQVSVVTKTVKNVVTAPDSALTMVSATTATVQILSGSTATSHVVTVGAVGGGRAQVTGLKAGQQLVIADLQTPLATNSSTTGANGLTSTGGGSGRIGRRG